MLMASHGFNPCRCEEPARDVPHPFAESERERRRVVSKLEEESFQLEVPK